jgi:hypothetical protein
MMDALPAYYRDDPASQAVVDSAARELDRIEEMLKTIQFGAFPQTASSLSGVLPSPDLLPSPSLLPSGEEAAGSMLRIWEWITGLPVHPTGVSVADRRRKVSAKLRRNVRTGRGWVQAITDALGTVEWDYNEYADQGRIVLRLPAGAGTYQVGVMGGIARELTPAPYEIATGFHEGFLLGLSELGDAL